MNHEAFEKAVGTQRGIFWNGKYYTTRNQDLIPAMDRMNELYDVWGKATKQAEYYKVLVSNIELEIDLQKGETILGKIQSLQAENCRLLAAADKIKQDEKEMADYEFRKKFDIL